MTESPLIVTVPFFTEQGSVPIQLVASAERSASSEKLASDDPFLGKMVDLALAGIANARRTPERRDKRSQAEKGAELIKEFVLRTSQVIEKGDPKETLKFLKRRALEYTMLVCVPEIYASQLQDIPNGRAYAEYFVFECLRYTGDPMEIKNEKLGQRLKKFAQDYARNYQVQEKFKAFAQSVIGKRDEFFQGALAELIFFRFCQQAGLTPECASVFRDVVKGVDYTIEVGGKKLDVQVKSAANPSLPKFEFQADGKPKITIGAPAIVGLTFDDHYQRMLHPTPELTSQFAESLKYALRVRAEASKQSGRIVRAHAVT